MTTINCSKLRNRMHEGFSPVILDVLPPEIFARQHLTGAINACVYEMVFLENINKLIPDLNTPVVLYDATGRTMAAKLARERMAEAGYRNVRILAGGLEAWDALGFPVESAGEKEPEPAVSQRRVYQVDPSKSRIEWSGRNLNGRHLGTIAISGGSLTTDDDQLTGGSVTLDMTSIENRDLQDEGYRSMLIAHLKSADFFDVERFPTAVMVLEGSESIERATPGTPNYLIHGRLTIKGVEQQIDFPAIISPEPDGTVRAQATLEIDRTLWQVIYGSGKLFEYLGMHLVNDLMGIELFITAA